MEATTNQRNDPLVPSSKAAVTTFGIKPQTLRARRQRGESPPFVRIGTRVYYRQSVLDKYTEERTFSSTSEESAKKAEA